METFEETKDNPTDAEVTQRPLARTTAISSITSPIMRKKFPRSYTVYTVKTQFISDHQSIDCSVVRRFSEFKWLHDSLAEMCPGVIIPPLPKKDYFGRFNEEFVESRIRGLEAFLHRLTRHPLLLSQPFTRSFLETQEIQVSHANLKSMKDSRKNPSTGLSSWIATKVGEISVSKQEIRMATCETTQSEAGLAPIKDSISESLNRIQRVNRATTNLVVGYSHYERLLEAHCAACNSLNTFEDLHDPPTTTTAVNEFARSELNLTTSLNETLHAMRVEVQEPITRLSQSTLEFSHTLALQEHLHEQFLLKFTLLQKKKVENKANPELEMDVQKREELYHTVTRNIVSEYDIYSEDKTRDLMRAVTQLANIQIRHIQQTTQELETLAVTLDRLVIESLPQPVPTAPLLSPRSSSAQQYQDPYPIVASEAIVYDPTVRTINGHVAGRVMSARYLDLSHSTSAELLKEQESDHHNEEIIIGV